MSGLERLQRWMFDGISRDLTLRSLPSDAPRRILPNLRLGATARLKVYNDQYWMRLLESLGEDFPGLRRLLGPVRFERLCRDYLARCPSRSWTLRNLGERLPGFLSKGAAADMARFEWAKIVAFDAAELPRPDLAGADASLRLALQPHLTLLKLSYEVDRKSKNPRRKRLFVAVHRQGGETVYHKRLAPEEFAVLEALGRGLSLGRALQAATVSPARLQAWFRTWAALGWFARPGSGS